MDREVDVVIAGGGIAGMSAGVASARLGRSTLVLTGDVIGGQLMSIETIEGFPGFPDGVPGYDLCPMVQDQAVNAGAEFMMTGLERIASHEGRWRVKTGEGDVVARAVILATGSSLKALGVPGEERLRGRGVSHCAGCDGPLLRERTVAVIGGGDSAMQEALTLAEFAAKVIMLQRGPALTGQASYRERVSAHPKIAIRFGVVVTEILGEETVTGLRIQAVPAGDAEEMELAAVFPYLGLQPSTGILDGVLQLDALGAIPTDGWMRTALPGLCAAGTVRSQSPCRAVSAAGDGASAAVAVDRYLTDGSWRDVGATS